MWLLGRLFEDFHANTVDKNKSMTEILIDHILYIIGRGYIAGSNSIFIKINLCDITRDQIAKLAGLKTARNNCTLAKISKRYIFAIGGDQDSPLKYLQSCERYDIIQNKWEIIASLTEIYGY